MTSKSTLLLFRILTTSFLITSFIVFYEMNNEIEVFGMMLTVMMTIAYVAAELIDAGNRAKE